MTEELAVLRFEKYFISGSIPEKKSALYGLGKSTEQILKNFPDYPITGLLDGYRTDGEAFGKPVLSLNQLPAAASRIIITARPGSEKIIFRRIASYCRQHKVEVYNLQGENLLEKGEPYRQNYPYFDFSQDTLKREIDSHEIISFDIFGTLLTRQTLEQEDLLRKISHGKPLAFNFISERMKAEQKLSLLKTPDIFEIYEEIGKSTGCSQMELLRLMAGEIQAELMVLRPRPAVLSLFQYAIQRGKSVYLLSDMYLPENLLSQILHNFSIIDYRALFVSCRYGADKASGLFQLFKDDVGSPKNDVSFLHIGDDEERDIQCAGESGMDTFLIKSPYALSELAPVWQVLAPCAGAEGYASKLARAELGNYLSRAFQDPFCLYQSNGLLRVSSAYEFGYLYIAPIMAEFILWMIGKLRQDKFDRVWFISRDGYVLKKLYDMARGYLEEALPPAFYLMTSRSLCVNCCLKDETDLKRMASLPFNGSPEELLHKRFHLPADRIRKFDKASFQNITEYIMTHSQEIHLRARVLRQDYQIYLDQFAVKPEEHNAIFDFVSTGTCQECLEEIWGLKMTGLYFCQTDRSQSDKPGQTIWDFAGSLTREANLSRNYFLLENLIKEPGPSLSHFAPGKRPVFCEEGRSKLFTGQIQSVQQAITDYFSWFLRQEGIWDENKTECPSGIGSSLLSLADCRYMDAQTTGLFDETVRDEFYNREIQLSL